MGARGEGHDMAQLVRFGPDAPTRTRHPSFGGPTTPEQHGGDLEARDGGGDGVEGCMGCMGWGGWGGPGPSSAMHRDEPLLNCQRWASPLLLAPHGPV